MVSPNQYCPIVMWKTKFLSDTILWATPTFVPLAWLMEDIAKVDGFGHKNYSNTNSNIHFM